MYDIHMNLQHIGFTEANGWGPLKNMIISFRLESHAIIQAQEWSKDYKAMMAVFDAKEKHYIAMFFKGEEIPLQGSWQGGEIQMGKGANLQVVTIMSSDDPEIDITQPMVISVNERNVFIHPLETEEIGIMLDFFYGKPCVYFYDDDSLENGGEPGDVIPITEDWQELLRKWRDST